MVNRDRTVLMVDSREDKPESWYGFVIVFLCWRVESHFRRRSVHVTVQNGSKIHSSTVIRMVVFVGMSDLVHTIVIGYPLICQQRSNFVPRALSILKGIEECLLRMRVVHTFMANSTICLAPYLLSQTYDAGCMSTTYFRGRI